MTPKPQPKHLIIYDADRDYENLKPLAKLALNWLQFSVGFLIIILLGIKLGLSLAGSFYDANYSYPDDIFIFSTVGTDSVLSLVAQALAVSAAIELAYMLFT